MGTVQDGLQNVIANLGTEHDKAIHGTWVAPLITEAELASAYKGSWAAEKIVEIPADDACREWREWQAEADQITQIEAEEARLGVQIKVRRALKLNRLYGGSAMLIGDGGNPQEPLEPTRIGKSGLRYLTVMSRRELTEGEIERDPQSEWYGQPKSYRINSEVSGSLEIHPSRLVRFFGVGGGDAITLMEASGTNTAWGDSVLRAGWSTLRNAGMVEAAIASLIPEAKVDVIKVKDMMTRLADPEYEKRLLDRFRIATRAKSINNTLLLDAEEEWEQKTATFQGLRDILYAYLQAVSAVGDIPVTRFLGQTPSGLSSTGESDLRNYYDHVAAIQKLDIAPQLTILDECLINSALGSRPTEIHYNWRSLWQPTAKERAEIGDKLTQMIDRMAASGLWAPEVLAQTATNILTEAGVTPGLEAAAKEFESANPDWMGAEGGEGETASVVGDALPKTLYVNRRVVNAAEIIAWAKEQGLKVTLSADDLHVTIAFSRAALDWMKIGQPWESEIRLPAGGPRLIEKFDGGAVVLLFKSHELEWRHEAFREAGASWDWPEYQPHITLTYEPGDVDIDDIEPFQGEILLGPELFAEVDDDWKSRIFEE